MQPASPQIHPIEKFKQWFSDAKKIQEHDPYAMSLATATKSGRVSNRFVLYKGTESGSFLFYTNYQSRKARELDENPFAALAIYWPRCYRQVRVEGRVERLSAQESSDYFESRSRNSQIAAWASEQSREIDSRDFLLEQFELHSRKFDKNSPVSRPSYWGGYRLIPEQFEFWEGQADRLHDRMLYNKREDCWIVVRLAP